jgi:aryl-alcohol dehydrogenase-like predicted oxidoreductase
VSTLTLGTMMFGDRTDEAASREIVAHARDAGVNFIDTADVYTKGESERITGARSPAHRDHWVLATKVGNRWRRAQQRRLVARVDPARVRREPRPPRHRPHRRLLPAPRRSGDADRRDVGAIGDLIRPGKVRYFGVSNFRGWRIAEVVRACERLGVRRRVVCQPYYNLLNRGPRSRSCRRATTTASASRRTRRSRAAC